MAISSAHMAAERALRELLPDAGLPQPDEVSYDEASVVFLWHGSKLAVIVDLEEGAPAAEGAAAEEEAAAAVAEEGAVALD